MCRDFWRKVFADDLINLRDSDARKEIVDQFKDQANETKSSIEKIDKIIDTIS